MFRTWKTLAPPRATSSATLAPPPGSASDSPHITLLCSFQPPSAWPRHGAKLAGDFLPAGEFGDGHGFPGRRHVESAPKVVTSTSTSLPALTRTRLLPA